MSAQPLLDHAAGQAQDARADLYLAFKRCASWRKTTQTNLHVRELLFWINAMDVERRGVAKSAAEVAERLELKDGRAARYVIARAEEFGLLIVSEDRYQRGGQTVNRYSINWPLVRAIRAGQADGNPWREELPANPPKPGTTECDGGATELQGGATELHPYKEHSRTITKTKSKELTTTSTPHAGGCESEWEAVVRGCLEIGMSAAGTKAATDAARARGLTAGAATELQNRYRALHGKLEGVTPGWLFRWFTGQSEPPAEDATPPARGRGDALTRDQCNAEALRARIVHAGRAAGAAESDIAARCAAAGVQY